MFLDESGVGFTPPVRRTWAPRGHTPVLRHRQRHWARLSMAAMCCYRPDGGRARLAFHLQPGSYNDQLLIGVLGQLRRFLHGQKVTLLWDGLPSHRSRPMQAFVASQRGWLVVERLPGYAPELNPVEGVWANLKGQEFANYAADTLDDLTRKPAVASPGSVADQGCCSPSLTAPAFRYDHQSPYSEKILSQHGTAGSVPRIAWVIHAGVDGATPEGAGRCPVSLLLVVSPTLVWMCTGTRSRWRCWRPDQEIPDGETDRQRRAVGPPARGPVPRPWSAASLLRGRPDRV